MGKSSDTGVPRVEQDSFGFEDIDKFFAAEATNGSLCSGVSKEGTVGDEESENFDYDTSDSISDEDISIADDDHHDDSTDEIAAEERRIRQSSNPGPNDKPLRGKKETRRRSPISIGADVDASYSTGSSMPLEDSVDPDASLDMTFRSHAENMSAHLAQKSAQKIRQSLGEADKSIDSISNEFNRSRRASNTGAGAGAGAGVDSCGTPTGRGRSLKRPSAAGSSTPYDTKNGKDTEASPMKVKDVLSDGADYDDNVQYDDAYHDADTGAFDDVDAGADTSVPDDKIDIDTSVLDKSARRVSFGGDVKEAAIQASVKKHKGSSRHDSGAKSAITTPISHGSAHYSGDDDGDDDDGVDGGGASLGAILSTPGTATTADTSMMTIPTPGSMDFPRGTRLSDESFRPNDDDDNDDDGLKDSDDAEDEDEDGATDKSGFTDSSYLEAARRRALQDEDDTDDDEDDGEDDEDGRGIRRSRRATKGQRFAFWKGERPVYESGNLVGLLRADPTPRKPKRKLLRNGVRSGPAASDRNAKKAKVINDENVPTESALQSAPFDLPKKVKYFSAETAGEAMMVWDESAGDSKPQKVLCLKESLNPPTALPMTAPRKDGNNKVGFAAQYFNAQAVEGVLPGWIAGYVELPAGAIKDEETVGQCAQVFFVSECQNGAIEMGIAHPQEERWEDRTAQRYLLSKGDSFVVPPGNIYRLQNHSQVKACTMFWTIIKPVDTQIISASVNQTGAQKAASLK
jgi:hypothetical protein